MQSHGNNETKGAETAPKTRQTHIMKSIQRPLTPEFNFAGFAFPKYVWSLPRGPLSRRLERAKYPITGGYYHAPRPIEKRADAGQGFYLKGTGSPFSLRGQWCDGVEGVRIGHTGWFCDKYQDDKIRGIVFRLPKRRGFLAGWSMGEGIASEVEGTIYESEEDAARAADSLAERVAEDERESREEAERERQEAEEREEAERLTAALCSAE